MSPTGTEGDTNSGVEHNPYRTPAAPVRDEDSEDAIRRDGKYLVLGLFGGLHSMCAHCGSRRELASRTVPVVWRHPVGCLGTLGMVIVVIASIYASEHVSGVRPLLGWLVIGAGVVVILINLVWRSRRIKLNYALCLDCRARRGRWIMAWALVLSVVVAGAMLVDGGLLLAALVLLAVAERLQPAAIRPARIVGERVWLRGVREFVLERFAPLDDDEHGA